MGLKNFRHITVNQMLQDLKIKYSSLAQSVEHAAVNRRVVGSSPTRGARECDRKAICEMFPIIFILSEKQFDTN